MIQTLSKILSFFEYTYLSYIKEKKIWLYICDLKIEYDKIDCLKMYIQLISCIYTDINPDI